MRFMQNQPNGLILTRQEKTNAILPILKSYLAENSHEIAFNLTSSTKESHRSKKQNYSQFQPFIQERDYLGRLISKKPLDNINSSLLSKKNIYSTQEGDLSVLHLNKSSSTSKLQTAFLLAEPGKSSTHKLHPSFNQQDNSVTLDEETNLKNSLSEEITIKSIAKQGNMSRFLRPNEWTQSTTSIQKDSIPQNSTEKFDSIDLQSVQESQHKSKVSNFPPFLEALLKKHEGFNTQTEKYLDEVTRQLRDNKKRMIIKKPEQQQPGIGQYEVRNIEDLKFKKIPIFHFRKGLNKTFQPIVKDSLELFMLNQEHKKKVLAEIKEKKRQQQADRDIIPIPSNNSKHQVRFDELFEDEEGEIFKKMNEEFHQYQQDFTQKIEWASKRVQKMQNTLKNWDQNCKDHFKEAKKNPLSDDENDIQEN